MSCLIIAMSFKLVRLRFNNDYNFPSLKQENNEKDDRKALYFSTDADVVSNFLPFT
jgi:hypothetical protein